MEQRMWFLDAQTHKYPRQLRHQRRACPLRLELLETRHLLSGIALQTDQAFAAYGQLPLGFEANQGQTDPQVDFLARGAGYALYLTPSQAVLALKGGSVALAAASTVLRMELIGSNPEAQATGLEPLSGTSNYLVGNDSSQWRTGISTYGRIQYQQVYRGVDLAYYGNQSRLEYDFIVNPGADPGQIGIRLDGAEGV